MANDKRFIAKNGFASLGDSTVGSTVFTPQADLHILNAVADATATTLKIGSNGGAGNNIPRIELAESSASGTMHYGFSITADGANTNNLLIRNHNNSNAGNVALSIDRVNANVGIGTATPGDPLVVYGSGTMGGAATNANSYFTITDGTSSLLHDPNEIVSTQAGTFHIAANDAAGAIQFQTGGTTPRMTIESAGRVGIGITNPHDLLVVSAADAVAQSTLYRSGTNLSANSTIGILNWDGAYNGSETNYGQVAVYANALSGVRASMDLRVKSTSGSVLTGLTLYGTNAGVNVGVGTVTPSGNFQVHSDNNRVVLSATTANLSAQHRLEFWEGASVATSTDANFAIEYDGTTTYGGDGALLFRGYGASPDQVFAGWSRGGNSFLGLQGNVGIGTTNPGYKLDVRGNSHFDSDMIVGNPVGNVGHITIGSAENNQQNGYIRGNILFTRNEDQITWDNANGNWVFAGGSSTDWSMIAHTSSAFRIYTGASQSTATTKTNADFITDHLRIDVTTAGDVGIGVQGPGEKLDVGGDTRIRGSGSTMAGTTIGNASLLVGSTSAGIGIDNNEIFCVGDSLYLGSQTHTIVRVGASEIARFENTGDVGIGTNNPETRMHLYEAATAPVLLTLHNYQSDINPNGTQGNFIDFKMLDDNATATPQVRIGMRVFDNDLVDAGIASEGTGNFVVETMDPGAATDGTGTLSEKFRITEKGKVGIGNTTPWSKLWVEGDGIDLADWSFEDASSIAQLSVAGSNAHVRLHMGTLDVSPYAGYIQAGYDNTPDNSGTGNAGIEPLLLNPVGGRVGINTTDPGSTSTLHVHGKGTQDVGVGRFTAEISSAAYGAGIDIVPIGATNHTSPFIRFYDTPTNGGYNANTVDDTNWAIGADDTGVSSFKFVYGGANGSTKIQSIQGSANSVTPLTLTSGLDVGIGNTAPEGKLHVLGGTTRMEVQSVPNGVVSGNMSALVEATEAQLQIMAVDTGSWASNIVLTNAPASGTNRHWTIHHAPATHPTNPNDLCFRYLATNTTGQIGGDGSGAASETKMIITSDGKVGIGTNVPGVALDLETPGNTTDGTFYSTFTINNTGTSTWSRIRFDRSGVARWGLALGTDDKFRISNLYTGGTSTSPNDNCLVIDNNSDVGIGTGNPTHRLHVLGDEAVRLYSATNGAGVHINFSDHASGSYQQNGTLEYVHSDTQSFGSGNAFKFFGSETAMTLHVAGDIKATSDVTAYYSDPRLKDFHGTIPNALDKVNSLGGYYFTENARAKELGFTNDNMQVGVNAQEVEAVLPEVVTLAAIDDPENYKTVKYDKMVPLLIEAIKELTEQNKELKQRLDDLEGNA